MDLLRKHSLTNKMNLSNASFNFPFRPAVSFQHIMQGKHKNYDRLRISLTFLPSFYSSLSPFLSHPLYISQIHAHQRHMNTYTIHTKLNIKTTIIILLLSSAAFTLSNFSLSSTFTNKLKLYEIFWIFVKLGMEWSRGTLSGSEGGWPTARSVWGPPFGTGSVLRVVLCWP